MATSISPLLSLCASASASSQSPRLHPSATPQSISPHGFHTGSKPLVFKPALPRPAEIDGEKFVRRAVEYKFSDPVPDFADAETEKFREHMMNKLTKKVERYGDEAEDSLSSFIPIDILYCSALFVH